MMMKGFPALKKKGAKIHRSYSIDGIHPTWGGGGYDASLDEGQANLLAHRIVRNVEEWDLDGVDIFTQGIYTPIFDSANTNAGFHHEVFRQCAASIPDVVILLGC